ncbi:geranylgeranyl reductase [Gloeothece citriformis PCC 7424]|uniref:Geranylgeranyl reductase n=1 Tax=Gloeothece citriformis (strain PCC 7424) TaxID=65393 RepID=B7KDE6_GLOC7|nr:geranylgeranyl reductase family protein [Gloeothece citriformis]ACK68966.1 geranylgeranyl reductase [Gloeothece citriformis PCC 7424]
MFDCIVVGSGPAGATASYFLAKKGHSVLLLDKVSLPRYKPCGGGVSPVIAQWFDFDFTPVIETTVNRVEFTWKLGDPVQVSLKDIEPMWMVKRDKFDYLLVQEAQKAGAQLQDNTEVTAIAFKDNQWQVTTTNGTFNGTYLIAADGVKGKLAQWLGFKPREEFIGATLEVPCSVEKPHQAYFDFGSLKNGYIWNFPKSDGYTISGGCFKGKNQPQEIKQQLTNYAKELGLDLSQSQYSEYALSLWADHQPLHTNHALLAGESAGICDPLLGEGIRPSILTGLRAAEAIDQALGNDDQALANYSQIIQKEWGADMVLASRLAGIFYQFPKVVYKVGVKRPSAAQIMAKILCGELRYSDVTEKAMQRLKKRLIPGFGG